MASSLNKGYIRDIVSQVKSGAKSKTDAFNELKQILQTTTSKPEQMVPEDGNSVTPETDSSANKFSQQDRRNLINRLIEKKRNGRTGTDGLDITGSYDETDRMEDATLWP